MINQIELLKSQRKYLQNVDSSCIFPDYDGFGLANLPNSICKWLGISGFGEKSLNTAYPCSSQQYDQVILLLVDGLGWLRLQKWMQSPAEEFAVWKYLEQNNQLVPITSITPSTTCAALTTLNTGESPAAHGNLAYELWLKEFGVVANMITHTPMRFQGEAGSLKKIGIQPAEFLPVPTLDSHFISNGITVEALHPAAISHSSLTAMLFPMARLHSYFSLGDLWYQLRDAIKNSGNHSSYVFAYWSAVDELSHLYGPDDMRVQQAFRELSWYLTDLWKNPFKSDRKKTLLIITADHGLQATPVNETYNLNKHKAFLDCLVILPTGENRLPFLYIKAGKEEQVLEYMAKTWPGKFLPFSADEILSSGLLGSFNIYERTPDRLGDLVVVPLDDAYWWWATKENRLLGRHGGLSQHEMLVPLALMEL